MNKRAQLLAELQSLESVLRERVKDSALHAEFADRFGAMTIHQLGALRHLVDGGSLTMHELAEKMGVGASAVTQLVDRLVQQELVTRETDPSDRRVQRVGITPAAADAVKQFKAARRRHIASLFDPLDDEELEVFVSLVTRMMGAGTPAKVPFS